MEAASCKYLKNLSKAEFQKFIASFDVVLSDCDGVLWQEMDVIQGSAETVVKFRQLGKRFFYITNNNCKTRAELVRKCKSYSYEATIDDVLCSSYLAAIYLKQMNFEKKAYVVGSKAISKELAAQGIQHCGVGPDVMGAGDELEPLMQFQPDPNVGAVVVGFDKHFSYPKLMKAATYVSDPTVHFLGTNPDVERPSSSQNRFPGAGCFLAAIEALTGRKPTILGKPEPFVSEIIQKKYGIEPARTLMIGDNLNTDILLGKRCGFTTLLVMTGLTDEHDLKQIDRFPKQSIVPDFYADRLYDLLECFETLF